jgi:hypothetical protein
MINNFLLNLYLKVAHMRLTSLFPVFVLALLVPMFAGAAIKTEPRVIIGLYDSSEKGAEKTYETRLHRLAELPLNHLGLMLEYHDIQQPLPNLKNRPDVRGVISWFALENSPERAKAHSKWLKQVVKKYNKKSVILGVPGFLPSTHEARGALRGLNESYALFGLKYEVCNSRSETGTCGWVSRTQEMSFPVFEEDMIGLEWPIKEQPFAYKRLKPIDSKAQVHASARLSGNAKTDSALVVTHPNGGIVGVNYAAYLKYEMSEDRDYRQWIINPFNFFAKAFDTDAIPKPDTTTLAGRRMYFSHIDGDGWNNVTHILKYRNRNILSAQVMMDELIKPYPDFPVSVAPIGADLDPAWTGAKQSREVAKELLALPQVEVGVHTFSHPFDWAFYEHYDPEAEKPYLHRFWQCNWMGEEAPKTPEDFKYPIEDYYVPRGFAVEAFDIKKEVFGAKDVVESFSGDKPATIFMWSGDCRPFKEAIKLTKEAGLYNINGGDSRFDDEYPSYGWLSAVGHLVDGYRQIYTAASNENIYTNGWQKPFMGFDKVVDTWNNSESPIRVKPMNLYYHSYSAERGTGLIAVKRNLDYARKQSLTPVKASYYAAIANHFYEVAFAPLGDNRWQVKDRGELQTIRFDAADSKTVDWQRSEGVIGQTHHQGSLYVYLDAAVDEPIVAMSVKGDALPERPYLIDSRWPVSSMKLDGESTRFTAQGYGKGEMNWQMPKAGRYEVRVKDAESQTVKTGSDGMLRVTLPVHGFERRDVEIVAVN